MENWRTPGHTFGIDTADKCMNEGGDSGEEEGIAASPTNHQYPPRWEDSYLKVSSSDTDEFISHLEILTDSQVY